MSDNTISQHEQVPVPAAPDQHTDPLILVLLPTYNGQAFLTEQIDSILSQTHQQLLLVCRDDGSTDESDAILAAYAQRFPTRVVRIQDGLGNLGASASFSTLMTWVLERYAGSADDNAVDNRVYVALADQDDIWHAEKLEFCLREMLAGESKLSQVPVLVHSDLKVVDVNGDEIASSFMRFQGLNPERTEFSSQLISNTNTGCTSLMNLALLKKALPVPPQAVMHDWWVSLVASAFGQIIYVPRQLIDYRQHDRNTLGAREHKKAGLHWRTVKKIFQLTQSSETQIILNSIASQAAEFRDRYEQELSEEKMVSICETVKIPKLCVWQQRYIFCRLAWKNSGNILSWLRY